MKLPWLILGFLCIFPLKAGTEKDLNLETLKKAHTWLLDVSQEANVFGEEIAMGVDLSNVDSVWDGYKLLMKKSIILMKKYPKKIAKNITETFCKNNADILPILTFYMYAGGRKGQSLRYYDAFNTTVRAFNPDLWVALIPFQDPKNPTLTNYSVLILDLKNHEFITKD